MSVSKKVTDEADSNMDLRALEVPDSPRELADHFYRLGLSDGLPIIPPTSEALEQFLAANQLHGDEFYGRIPPKMGAARANLLAVNAIMAGCHAREFPLLLAAVHAILEEDFNLHGLQATTHPGAPVIVVNGPVRHDVHMTTGSNAMGDGNQSAATLGRALRFLLRNVGGAVPGESDLVAQGSPIRRGLFFAENEEQSPFEPFHTTRGFDTATSAVTAFGCEGPHNINDHSSNTGLSVLKMIGGTMATLGTNDLARPSGSPLLVLGLEHAQLLHRDGFGRRQVQEWLFENARVPLDAMPTEMVDWLHERADVDHSLWSQRGVPIAKSPDDISVVVAGGPGRHSCFLPSFGYVHPTSSAVDMPAFLCDC